LGFCRLYWAQNKKGGEWGGVLLFFFLNHSVFGNFGSRKKRTQKGHLFKGRQTKMKGKGKTENSAKLSKVAMAWWSPAPHLAFVKHNFIFFMN
jgi:hypothetical protein